MALDPFSKGIDLVKVLAMIGAAIWALTAIYGAGADSMDKKWREKQVEAKKDQVHSIRTLRDSLRSLSMDMADKVEELNAKSYEDKKYAQLAKDNLMDAIMSGDIRVRIRTQARSVNGSECGRSASEVDNSEGESGAVAETTSELHPTDAANLFGITADADELAGDYNDLVDYTELVLDKCAAKRED